MAARPEIVTLLADLNLGEAPDKHYTEWTHHDGRRLTPAETELVGAASPDDFRAVVSYLDAQQEYDDDLSAARDRLMAIIMPRYAQLPAGSVMSDVLAVLPPDERAEVDELTARLFPDGNVYFDGSGPRV